MIDKLERLPLLLTPLLTKRFLSNVVMNQRDFTAFTSLLVKRDLQLLTSLRSLKTLTPCTIPVSLLLLHLMLLLFNSWLHIQVALLVNTSEMEVNTPLLSMTISPSKLLLTDKCLFFLEDHQAEKLTQVMFSIYIPVFLREPLR